MTTLETLREAIEAFDNKIYNKIYHNRIALPMENEIVELSKFLHNQYRLLSKLNSYEQTVLNYTELSIKAPICGND